MTAIDPRTPVLGGAGQVVVRGGAPLELLRGGDTSGTTRTAASVYSRRTLIVALELRPVFSATTRKL